MQSDYLQPIRIGIPIAKGVKFKCDCSPGMQAAVRVAGAVEADANLKPPTLQCEPADNAGQAP
jgi:hypothetical protein